MACIFMFIANTSKNKMPFIEFFLIVVVSIILIFFAGIREHHVGTDTLNYRDMFVYKRNETFSLAYFIGGVDPGFALFQVIFQKLTENFVIYLFGIATFVVSIYLYLIRKMSTNYGVTIFVFICLGTYLFFFNGARQAMAAAVYSIALLPLINKKMFQYGLITIAAALFHKTAIIMLPLYFVFTMKYSFKQVLLLVLLTTLATSGLSIMMSIAPDILNKKFTDYHNRTSGGGAILMVVYFIMTSAFVFLRRYICDEDRRKYDVYLNMAIFTATVYLVVNIGGQDVNLIRFTLYAAAGFMFIWPLIFKNLRMFKSVIPWVLFYGVHLLFFFIYIKKMIGPYKVNPELF